MNAARRRNDDVEAKRSDDITVKALGVELVANGKTVINILLSAAVLSGFWLLYAFQVKESEERKAEHGLYTYVLTMTQAQRERVQPYLRVPKEFAMVLGELRNEKAAEQSRDETHKFQK